MKIIFLDIDGVELPGKSHLLPVNLAHLGSVPKVDGSGNKRSQFEILKDYSVKVEFDQSAIMLTNRLAEKAGAKIVIHSNWRKNVGVEKTKECLIKAGICEDHFHEDFYCHYKMSSSKASEVSLWLSSHRVNELPERPDAFLPCQSGYDASLSEAYEAAMADHGIDYVVIDDESVMSPQVAPVFQDGFGVEEYRQALGILGGEDPELGVYQLSDFDMERVSSMIPVHKERFKWLYSLNNVEGRAAPRAALLSRNAAKEKYSKSIHMLQYYRDEEALYESRSEDVWAELERIRLASDVPDELIVDIDSFTRVTGIEENVIQNLPREFPCLYLGQGNNKHEFLYAPAGCDAKSFLVGYLSSQQKADVALSVSPCG